MNRFSCFLKGQYSKITFRTPLYLGGAPSTYWLVRATGTHRGFQGCVQALAVNGEKMDMRPWPLGRALSGADVGEWLLVGWGRSGDGLSGGGRGQGVSSLVSCSLRRLVDAEPQEEVGPGEILVLCRPWAWTPRRGNGRAQPASPTVGGCTPGLSEMRPGLTPQSSRQAGPFACAHPARWKSWHSNGRRAFSCSLLLREMGRF